jgi:class 3 adenylate cyclase
MEGADRDMEASYGSHQLAAVMFTDIVGFSARTHANEEETLHLVRKDINRIKEIAEKHRGRVLKTMGDGVLIHFHSATDAVRCGMEFQGSMQNGFGPDREKSPLQHRVGIHLGDMYVSESEIMGDSVNIASRLQTIAEPGGICVSQTVYDIIKNKVALKATHLGAKELKNISHAVHVYKIIIDAMEGEEAEAMALHPGRPVFSSALGGVGWKVGAQRISQEARSWAGKGQEAVRRIIPNPKARMAAVVATVLVCAGLVTGSLFASRPASGPVLAPPLKELAISQVEGALAGSTVEMGKVLFVTSRGEVQKKDILSVTPKETSWDAGKGCYHSTYAFVLRVRGGKMHYQAVIDHDGNRKILKTAITGPL